MEDGSGNAGRKATLVLLSNVAGAGLGYVALLLIGRYFAPDSYGAYLFALSVTGLAAVVSNLGLGIAHQRHVAQGVEAGKALGVLARLRLAIALPVLGLGTLAYLVWAATREQAVTDATTTTVLAIALTIQVLSGVRQSLFDTWQGQQRVHLVEGTKVIDTCLVVLLLANAALMVAHLQGRWEVVPGIGAFWAGLLGLDSAPTLAQGAVLLASSYLLAKALSLLVALAWWSRQRIRTGPWDRELARSYLRLAMPFALAGSLALILQYTDTLLLGFTWTSHEVGLYGVAQRLASLCLLGALAVGTVLFPRFAQLHAAGDSAGEQATFGKAERYLLVLVVPIAAAFVALPREGLHIAVGDQYLDSAIPLQLLALWALVATAEQPMTSRMMGAGQARLLVRSAGLNVGANVALNLILVPPAALGMGPTGAALSTLVSTAMSYVYVRHASRRQHGIPWVSMHQVRILLAGAIVGVGWWAAADAMPQAFLRVWQLAGWGIAGGLAYFVLLLALGELHRRDLGFLRHVAHPGRLVAELRGR
jgi:O-antigen/teichoic acid export membrane protein